MRSVVNALVGIVTTTIATIFCLLVLPFFPGGRGGAYVCRHWSRLLLRGSGIRVELTVDPAVGKGPYMIVANHCSMLDINLCAATVPAVFHFVSRPFFFKIPILGWGMFFGRHVSLDPKKPRKAARVLKGLHKRFDRGLSVLLFPEGTRSPDGTVRNYKRGPFMTAIQNGVPLLPVHHQGTHQLLPKGSVVPRSGILRVHVGAPISTEGMSPPDARALAERVETWTRLAADR